MRSVYEFAFCVANPPAHHSTISFELAVAPVRTRCCAHVFCAERIVAVRLRPYPCVSTALILNLQWHRGPASNSLCPSYGIPGLDLLALGYPGLTHPVPPARPPARSPSPCSSPISPSAAPYAAYPSTPAVLSHSQSS